MVIKCTIDGVMIYTFRYYSFYKERLTLKAPYLLAKLSNSNYNNRYWTIKQIW